jgi:hypothetical protein
MRPNPAFFLVGCPRSGTTLLQRLLDAHPDVAVVNETSWITRLCRPSAQAGVGRELVDWLERHPRFARLGLDHVELEQLVGCPPPVFVESVFDSFAARRGKRVAGDKTPGYVQRIGTIHRLLPRAKFVHVVRDGRDVAVSALGWEKAASFFDRYPTWSRDPITTAALWWERNVLLGREAGTHIGPDLYLEVLYERVVEDTEAAARAICEFLDLRYSPSMLRFHEGRTTRLPSLSTKRQWLPPTRGLRDWRSEMARRDLERFEAAAGDLLDRLGYSRAVPTVSRKRAQHAADVRRLFAEGVRARRRSLPQEWAA